MIQFLLLPKSCIYAHSDTSAFSYFLHVSMTVKAFKNTLPLIVGAELKVFLRSKESTAFTSMPRREGYDASSALGSQKGLWGKKKKWEDKEDYDVNWLWIPKGETEQVSRPGVSRSWVLDRDIQDHMRIKVLDPKDGDLGHIGVLPLLRSIGRKHIGRLVQIVSSQMFKKWAQNKII